MSVRMQKYLGYEKSNGGDFPGGPGVKNPPSNAGTVGSIPGQGTKIPYAAGQLNLPATTTEPTCPGALEPMRYN